MVRRTKAEAQETRQRIIDAAEHIFFLKGVSDTTLEDVAREAGVTRGAIYWHFANKVALFLALYETVNLPQEDMLAHGLDEGVQQTMDRLESAGIDWLTDIASDQQRQRIYTILLRCDYRGELVAVLNKQKEAEKERMVAFTALFQDAQKQGYLRRNWSPDAAARTICWAMKGLVSDWLLFGQNFDLVCAGKDMLSRLFEGFREDAIACQTLTSGAETVPARGGPNPH